MGSVMPVFKDWERVTLIREDFSNLFCAYYVMCIPGSGKLVFPKGTDFDYKDNTLVAELHDFTGRRIPHSLPTNNLLYLHSGKYYMGEVEDEETHTSTIHLAVENSATTGGLILSYEGGGKWVPSSFAGGITRPDWWAIMYCCMRELQVEATMRRMNMTIVDGEAEWAI